MNTQGEHQRELVFLFTDIEGSTRLWDDFPQQMMTAIVRHNEAIDSTVERLGGHMFSRAGDGCISSFANVESATVAAIDLQRLLADAPWAVKLGLRVRTTIHRGPVAIRGDMPFGWTLNVGSRVTSLGHGGQILASAAAAAEVPAGLATVESLGWWHVKDVREPLEIFSVEADGLPHDFPPLRQGVLVGDPLSPPSETIGRGEELAIAEEALSRGTPVVVTGPPGAGKSHLGLEIAHRFQTASSEVVHVDLRNSPGDALVQLARAADINIPAGQDPLTVLTRWLRRTQPLVIIDHGELDPDGVEQLHQLAVHGGGPGTLLTLSQQRIGEGGVLIRLSPLELDDAVAVFTRRCAGLGLDPTGLETAAVAELCATLDCLPLPIELAAAHCDLYGPSELVDELAELEAPESVWHSVDRAVSVALDRLEPQQLSALQSAAVFRGPFDRRWFREVCLPAMTASQGDQMLGDLVDRSLVNAEQGAQVTFRLLGGVQRSVMADCPETTLAHARQRLIQHAVRLSNEASQGLRGIDEGVWVRRLERSYDNLEAAFDASLEHVDLPAAVALATSLWEYGFMRMRADYFDWGERLLDAHTDQDPIATDTWTTNGATMEGLLGSVRGVAALGAWMRDEPKRATDLAHAAVAAESAGAPFDLPARMAIMNAASYQGLAEPTDVVREAITFQHNLGEPYFSVNVDAMLSLAASFAGDIDRARRRAVRALRTAREAQNPSAISFSLSALGVTFDPEDLARAEALLGDALDTARSVSNAWLVSLAQMGLASVKRRLHQPVEAAPLLTDLIDVQDRGGHWSHLAHSLRLVALLLADEGRLADAAQLLTYLGTVESPMPPLPRDGRDVSLLHEQLFGQQADLPDQQTVKAAAAVAGSWDRATAVSQALAMLGTLG